MKAQRDEKIPIQFSYTFSECYLYHHHLPIFPLIFDQKLPLFKYFLDFRKLLIKNTQKQKLSKLCNYLMWPRGVSLSGNWKFFTVTRQQVFHLLLCGYFHTTFNRIQNLILSSIKTLTVLFNFCHGEKHKSLWKYWKFIQFSINNHKNHIDVFAHHPPPIPLSSSSTISHSYSPFQ